MAGCVVHCLTRPGVDAVMVSYSPGVFGILGDQFNCICARQGAIVQTMVKDPALCGVACPGERELKCGDTEQDVLSVYRLHPDTELCHHSEDTLQLQGCLSAQAVRWEQVLTLHDFDGLTVQDCHQRCSSEEGPGLSISRFISLHISYSLPYHGTRLLSGVLRQIQKILLILSKIINA